MAGYLLYLASLIVFLFGALTFTVLALSYWRERQPRGGRAFPAFTLLCAVAFVINLAVRVAPDSTAATGLMLVREWATGFLPAILLHLVWQEERSGLAEGRTWLRLILIFYCVCALAATAHGLSATEVAATRWADLLDLAPAAMLGLAGALGLIVQAASHRSRTAVERHHRTWNMVVLILMLASSATAIGWPNPLLNLLPDYLLLSFFCVTLYYKERLIFFDLLIKRGAYFAVSLGALTAFFAAMPHRLEPWMAALLLAPLWLMGPWMDRWLGGAIDRLWLRRRYSSAEAERCFAQAVQLAPGEEDLRARAEESLSDIFQTKAEVRFGEAAADLEKFASAALTAELLHHGSRIGWIALPGRPDSVPFMSDDRRLLQSLARTLPVVAENVRFREQRSAQEERERQLRLLASRAELKALRAQINPHFLFNALNAIAGLIQEQPQLADETIEQLAQVFRYTLRKSENEWVRLEEEVEFVAAYLRVEQARFGERLRVRLEVDPAAAAIPIPAMTIQPLIENAIKHGASAVEGPAAVRLSAAVRGEKLSIEVSDNGPGFPRGFSLDVARNAQPAGGHGLRNVAERLKGYYGERARLSWASAEDGTRVSLEIPLASALDAAARNVHVASTHSG